jgi:hypothetical protein
MKRMLGNFLTLIGLLSLTVPCLAQNGGSSPSHPPAARNLIGSPDIDLPIVAYLLGGGGSERYRLFRPNDGKP